MNEQEFLKEATSEIYSIKKRQHILCELHDHIALREERYKEMGYPESDAEEKSVKEMGDPQEIAKELGELHKTYKPTLDIILLLLYFAVLTGAYYLQRSFVFGDPGALSMLICGITGGAALFFLYAAYASSKKHPAAAVCAFAAGAAGGYYECLIGKELSRLTDGNFTNIKNFIAHNIIYFDRNHPDCYVLMTVLCVTGVVFSVICGIILIYGIKKSLFANNSTDNRINRFTTVLCLVLFAACTITAAGFGINTYRQINYFKDEYTAAYNFTTQIEEQCSTKEELEQFLKDCDYDFGNIDFNNIKNYTYSHNLVYMQITLYEPIEEEESADKKGFAKLMSDMEKKSDYASRYVYSVGLSSDSGRFDRGYDSLTLSVLKADENVIEELYSYRPYEHTSEEEYEYYKAYVPTEFSYKKCCRELIDSSFEFKYIEGTGELKDTNTFSFETKTQYMIDFRARENQITQILKSNGTVDPNEIARITGTTLIDPGFTKDEYEQIVLQLCNEEGTDSEIYEHKDELLNYYLWYCKYSIYEDWYFYLFRSDDYNIVAYNNDTDIFSYLTSPKDPYLHIVYLDDTPDVSFSEYNAFKKIKLHSGYFDKKGLYYDAAEKVRYYTESGKVYRYYTEIDYDEPDEDNRKKYYLIDNNSKKHPADNCFIDENGWLVIKDDLRTDKDGTYKNEKGETFTPAFETSWDENGNIVQRSDFNI